MRKYITIITVLVVAMTGIASAAKKPLTRAELRMAQLCLQGKPCGLTCNRAHEAGRDDLIRRGACAE